MGRGYGMAMDWPWHCRDVFAYHAQWFCQGLFFFGNRIAMTSVDLQLSLPWHCHVIAMFFRVFATLRCHVLAHAFGFWCFFVNGLAMILMHLQ